MGGVLIFCALTGSSKLAIMSAAVALDKGGFLFTACAQAVKDKRKNDIKVNERIILISVFMQNNVAKVYITP